MRKRNVYNRQGGGSLQTLRRLRKALAETRRGRETERKRALLCSVQRDFFGSLVGYIEEYFMIATRTEEELRQTKKNYKSFQLKKEQKYAEEAKPLIEALYRSKAKRCYAKMCCEPYYILEPERMRLTDEAERRTNLTR